MTFAELHVRPRRRLHPLRWPGQVLHLWRRSLQFRTVLITVLLSGAAILATGLVVSYSVANDLYQSRLQQALGDAARAQKAAQATVDASNTNDPSVVFNLGTAVASEVQLVSSTRLMALIRAPQQALYAHAPGDFTLGGLPETVLSGSLRQAVEGTPGQLLSQPVALPVGDDGSGQTDPGIVVGTQLSLASAGEYEFYLGYDLADSQQTLAFVQRTLLLAGLALIVLIGTVAYVVVRFVVSPIRLTADSSRRLASGELGVRIPETGPDVFATLAQSFNAMADSLQRQITQLAQLSQLQQRFVSDVSHELRTPLTTIRLASDVIYDTREGLDPAAARTAELLHTQVERFDSLLSDLLEISRYDAGSVALDVEPTSLVRVAEDVIEDLAALARRNGTELRLSSPGGHLDVPMDARRVRRIVSNLLGNAIEHGEGRPIDVLIDSSQTAVAVAVRDRGMGMSEADMAHVFDRFWRADPSRQRTLGGTGLGLAISQEDAAVHGGVIDVWSERGQGSCFRLTLPRRQGAMVFESPIPMPPPSLSPEDVSPATGTIPAQRPYGAGAAE